jgi:hypothetical protein
LIESVHLSISINTSTSDTGRIYFFPFFTFAFLPFTFFAAFFGQHCLQFWLHPHYSSNIRKKNQNISFIVLKIHHY